MLSQIFFVSGQSLTTDASNAASIGVFFSTKYEFKSNVVASTVLAFNPNTPLLLLIVDDGMTTKALAEGTIRAAHMAIAEIFIFSFTTFLNLQKQNKDDDMIYILLYCNDDV
jgi:hypothetical protein